MPAESRAHSGHNNGSSRPSAFRPPALSPGYSAAEDPDPNESDTATGLPDGGVPYSRLIGVAADFETNFEGIVGDRSWYDGKFSEPDRGHVRSCYWVAIHLKVPCEIEVTVSAQEGVFDFRSIVPGVSAGGELKPAFTIFRGWQRSGDEAVAFHNRGDSLDLPALEFLSFFEGESEETSVTGTATLEAGYYTIVIGGNTQAERSAGRKGFAAQFKTESLALPPSIWKTKRRYVTKKSRIPIKGRIKNHESAALLAVQQSRRNKTYRSGGSRWKVKSRRLKHGQNTVFVAAVGHDGKVSRWKRIKLIRK